MQASENNLPIWHGTTILTVRKGGKVVIGGDGQVSIGQTVIKANAKKVRKIGKGDVIGGFAGATADAFTLFERLESKLEQYPGQLTRAAVELAKDWRTDRYLRRLEAMMIVADKDVSLVLTGTGDVLEPKAGVAGIGSSEQLRRWPRRARCVDGPLDAEAIVRPLARYRRRHLRLHQPQRHDRDALREPSVVMAPDYVSPPDDRGRPAAGAAPAESSRMSCNGGAIRPSSMISSAAISTNPRWSSSSSRREAAISPICSATT